MTWQFRVRLRVLDAMGMRGVRPMHGASPYHPNKNRRKTPPRPRTAVSSNNLEASSKPDVSRNQWASRGLTGSLCGDPDAGGDLYHDRTNALRTRFRATISTSAHTMIRSPAASTISIWPVEPELECSTAVSGSIVTGKIFVTSVAAAGSKPNCRRQVKNWVALRS